MFSFLFTDMLPSIISSPQKFYANMMYLKNVYNIYYMLRDNSLKSKEKCQKSVLNLEVLQKTNYTQKHDLMFFNTQTHNTSTKVPFSKFV